MRTENYGIMGGMKSVACGENGPLETMNPNTQQQGKENMKKTFRWMRLFAVMGAAALLGGCATTDSSGRSTAGGASGGSVSALRCPKLSTGEAESSREFLSNHGSMTQEYYAQARQTPVESSQASSGARYVVNKGDTLYKISKTLGVSIQSLVRANNISNQSQIRVGMVLTVPSSTDV